MHEPRSTECRKARTATPVDAADLSRLRELKRTKLFAGGVLVASLAGLVGAQFLERRHPGFGFLAAFAEAATIGGLGGPIAHGYLTLSLVAAMVMELGVIPPDAATGLNYGLDKVRFIAPVKAGARVRTRARLI